MIGRDRFSGKIVLDQKMERDGDAIALQET
jgi:hypothetical protein